jgi:hypothetical protein
MVLSLSAAAVLLGALAGSGGTTSARHRDAAAKPKPTPIVIREFRFVGFDKDVVGRFRSTKPDGEPDGHFRVVLARPKGAPGGNALMIWRCASKPASGGPSVGPVPPACEGMRTLASMLPAPSKALLKPAVLAVFRDGKKLSGFGLKLPLSSKPVTFDLYVNGGSGCPTQTGHPGAPDCRAAFAPGQRYVLMVMQSPQPSWSAWISRPGDKVPQVTSPQAALRNLRFIGFDQDVTGLYPDRPLDGRPDAHWTVEIATPAGPRQLMNVTLERVKGAADRPDQPGAWCAPGCFKNSPPGPGFGLLYVSLNGERVFLVLQGQLTVELPYTTAGVRLDLYASDVEPSVFMPGQRFRVTARIAPEGGSPPGTGIDARPKYNPSTPWRTLP